MLVMGKSRALVVTVCLLVVGALLTPQQASADHAIDVVDKYAGRSRTYTAYTNDSGTIFEIKVARRQWIIEESFQAGGPTPDPALA